MALPEYIDKTWTLFLDRDGVLNEKIEGGYVHTLEDFHFLPGVLEALKTASELFKTIVVVTNQQGIGKGLMTEQQLHDIHKAMLHDITTAGGRIDGIYFAPNLKHENSFMRKPNPGMALKAQEDLPHINLHKSIMIGDSITDMEMGKRAGMFTVFIHQDTRMGNPLIDAVFTSLPEAVDYLKGIAVK